MKPRILSDDEQIAALKQAIESGAEIVSVDACPLHGSVVTVRFRDPDEIIECECGPSAANFAKTQMRGGEK